jgi:signal transduction histidine kinase
MTVKIAFEPSGQPKITNTGDDSNGLFSDLHSATSTISSAWSTSKKKDEEDPLLDPTMGLPRCGSVVVSVEDEGAGMDESQLHQLFGEEFNLM